MCCYETAHFLSRDELEMHQTTILQKSSATTPQLPLIPAKSFDFAFRICGTEVYVGFAQWQPNLHYLPKLRRDQGQSFE